MASADKKIFKCVSFTSTYISGLNTLRNGNHLNDVVLNVQGREFSCHKLVLAANSKYFLTMFTANVIERNSMEIRMPPEIAPEAMEAILDYFYSGELALSQINIESVFRATDYMRLDPLLEICIKYLKETLNLSNSVQRFVLAETIQYSSSHLEDLKKVSSALIVSGVKKVSGTEDFLKLSKEHISKLLIYNNQPKMAESLYWIILKWVSHDEGTRKEFLYDFLQTLPVEGFSNNFLKSTIKNEELLRRDPRTVFWVMDHFMSRITTSSLTLSEPSSFLFADRGFLKQKCFLVKKMDNPPPQAIQDRPTIAFFSTVSYKKRIYLFCGALTENSYQLNAPNESWVDCNLDLKFGRDCAGCVVLNDDLFVVGGRDWKNNYMKLSSCMKFDFCSGKKQSLPAMKETREDPGAAIYANSLYVAGGADASPSIERLDAREGRWCTAGQSATKLGWCSATTVADYLYCCSLRTGQVERFDFRTNRSQQISILPSVSWLKWCCISSVENDLFGASGGQIYVYGGVADKWNDFCCATDMIAPIIVPWV